MASNTGKELSSVLGVVQLTMPMIAKPKIKANIIIKTGIHQFSKIMPNSLQKSLPMI
jgi:hypothetical protein